MSSNHSAATISTALKLFDDPDLGGAVPLGDPLLLPAARESEGPLSRLDHRMASEELFRYHLSPAVLRQLRATWTVTCPYMGAFH